MASRKRKVRARKRSQRKRQSPETMVAEARQCLKQGDGRRALDRLRQAQHSGLHARDLAPLLFFACDLRSRQLESGGMEADAAAMRERAEQYQAWVDKQSVADEDFAFYLRGLCHADAFAAYADRLRGRNPDFEVERLLADKLVVQRCWTALEALPSDHPLRRDSDSVMQSLPFMDRGEWARAAEFLRPISRRSPFAAWRVFCKAMACFVRGEDEYLHRAVVQIPADFVLAGTVAELRRICVFEETAASIAIQDTLGIRAGSVQGLGEALFAALAGNARSSRIRVLLVKLSEALYPENPLAARMHLLLIAGLAVLEEKLSMNTLRELAQGLLPAGRVASALAQAELVNQCASRDYWDPAPAATYLGRLHLAFPDEQDRSLIRARVFEFLARWGHRSREIDILPSEMQYAMHLLLGKRIWDPPEAFLELMGASLKADPKNRDGHVFLHQLLSAYSRDKSRLRAALRTMATQFPNDPYPLLELARRDFAGGAYRRAERTLSEAQRLSPHDERLRDLQAAGLLKAADHSRNRGRFEIADRDIQRAEALDRKMLLEIGLEKRLLLELVSSGLGAETVVSQRMERLPPAGRLLTLALLLKDVEENWRAQNLRPELQAEIRDMLARNASLFDKISPDEALNLIGPVPADASMLYGGSPIASTIEKWLPRLLKRLDADRLFSAFDVLMKLPNSRAIRAEIGKRLRQTEKGKKDPLLLFYLAVIRYREGDDQDSSRFRKAIEAAGSSGQARLQKAAERLAKHEWGMLATALRRFNFDPLDMVSPYPPAVRSLLEDLLELENNLDLD